MPDNPANNDVRVYHCETWDQFTFEVRKTRYVPKENPEDTESHFGTGVIFRGHSNTSWLLSSKMERNVLCPYEVLRDGVPVDKPNLKSINPHKWYESKCDYLIQRFREYSAGIPAIPDGLSDLELWSIGRHYGLLSPYVDWSGSPYIAAFFAYEEIYKTFEFVKSRYQTAFEDGVVHVWGLRLWDGLEEEGVFEIERLNGPHGTRPRAQQAWFTRLRSSDHIDLLSYLESRGRAHYLERYDLDTRMAMDALRDLDLMNINYLTLLPDAIGAALHSNIDSDMFRVALAMPPSNDDSSS